MATTFKKNENGMYEVPMYNGEVREVPLMPLETLDLSISLTSFSKFKKDFCDWLRLNFGDAIVSEALDNHKQREIFTWQYIPYDRGVSAYSNFHGLMYDTTRIYPIKEYKGDGWERSVDKVCICVMKNTDHEFITGKVFKECLELRYPWMKNFKLSEYALHAYHGKTYDEELVFLYIPKEEREGKGDCVYCPVGSLINGDIETIKKTHTDYFNDYYKWPKGWGNGVTEEDVNEWRQGALNLLESPTFKKFYECYQTGSIQEEKMVEYEVVIPVTGYYKTTVKLPDGSLTEDIEKEALKQYTNANFGELENIEIKEDDIEIF